MRDTLFLNLSSTRRTYTLRRLVALSALLLLLALWIVVTWRPEPSSADGVASAARSGLSSAPPATAPAQPRPTDGVSITCDPVVTGGVLPESSR